MLKSTAKIDIVPIPYKGTVPAIIDVVAGQAQLMFAVMQGGLPQVKAGKLRAVAITGKKRHPAIPDVQTISEAGFGGADFVTWNGIHVPVKTPKAVVAKLNAEFDRILKLQEVRDRMFELGLDPVGGSAESFGAFVREDIARWAKVIKEAGVKAEQ
jgi:tripartite-type tricarboxylate transporter receptor subunit TctC